MALPIYTHIPNLKGLTKIFFKLSRQKGNFCGGGVTILNLEYPRLWSRDTTTKHFDITANLQRNGPKPTTHTDVCTLPSGV